MKIKINKFFSAFTLIELLVVIAIIAILAAFAVPALTQALTKGQMTGTMNNARQMYIAQFQMSNDGAATSDATSAWPGDLPTVPPDLLSYLNVLTGKGYLRGADAIKLLTAPGAAYSATVTTTGGVDSLSAPSGTAALKIWLVQDANPATTIFCTTKNYVYNTALNASDSPYGSRGFITVKKGGDAAIYRVGQAQAAGWTNGTLFQNSVGARGQDAVGTPGTGDPTTPGTGVLQFP
jgi:prepilin-type N-terminal cleavage/methylation domain-containing protein